MSRKDLKRVIIILILVIIAIAMVALVLFLRRNTSFLTFTVPEEELSSNNTNSELAATDLIALSPVELETNFELLENNESLSNRTLNLPAGFGVEIYASGLGQARGFDFDDAGNIIVADRAGRVVLVKDTDADGVGETNMVIAEGLDKPHGVEWYEGDLYVAEETQVVVFRELDSDGAYTAQETLISDLPTGGHNSRTVHIGPDEKLYLAVGSSCNVCEEDDQLRAAISRYTLAGEFEKVYAEGLRNTVDFLFVNGENEGTFQIWGVDNGRDLIGDDQPPEEVNVIREDAHYGWPYCYGDGIANPEYLGQADFCATETEFPRYNMQAHSAPLGLALPEQEGEIPEQLRENLFVGFHGSWNRSIPTGYKVVRIDTTVAEYDVIDFVTGWLEADTEVWGRPVHLDFDADNNLFISDDKAGVIYKVSYLD